MAGVSLLLTLNLRCKRFLSSSVRIKESHQQAKPMIHLDRNHKLALEFGALFDELEVARKMRAKTAAKKRA